MIHGLKFVLLSLILQLNLYGLDAVDRVSDTHQELISYIKNGNYEKFQNSVKSSDIFKRHRLNKTLLHYAVEYKRFRFVKFLIQKRSMLNAKGGLYVSTPLHEAIRNGSLKNAIYLIDHGSNVNMTDKYKQTSLHIASRMGLSNIVIKLINKGASLELKDYQGKTAYDIAKSNMSIEPFILEKMKPPKKEDKEEEMYGKGFNLHYRKKTGGSSYNISNSSVEIENENKHNKMMPENSEVKIGQ